MEPPDLFASYADPDVRERVEELTVGTRLPVEHDVGKVVEYFRHQHADPEFRSHDAEQIWLRKNWEATGSFLAEDRPAALDLLGFASQLVFNTFTNKTLQWVEHGDDLDLAYGLARGHNRAIVEFCSVDRRLLPVGYVPLADVKRSAAFARETLELGCRALMIASACPRRHSPSHIGLDPLWAQAQEAGIPIVFHVGGGGRLIDPMYLENGLPPVPDFHGGDDNFRSVDYIAIQYPVMQTMGTMIIDGILDRFPRLKVGVIEEGASWLPGLMRTLDSAADAFRKNEERLQKLELRPSEYIRRQVRVTPYPHEDAGWIVEQSGDEVCMFSSDYPHVEGGRNPLGRFERSLAGLSDDARRRFYCDNFVDLMGEGLAV
ncbi:MAG: amidohydrolase family protein [Actinobacteria bacterium]|nr:amidohydrolase family protein [Actinomycetota bacterium]